MIVLSDGEDAVSVEAQLLGLIGEMDTVVAEVARLQALKPQDAQPRVEQLVDRLRQQVRELQAFEREAVTIEETEK